MRTVLGSARAGGVAFALATVTAIGAATLGCATSAERSSSSENALGAHDAGPAPAARAAIPIASCDTLKRAQPDTADGFQMIDPDGDGPMAAFKAWCDMTRDNGGWMLVGPGLIEEDTSSHTTSVQDVDTHGGAIVRVYMNNFGCGVDDPSRHRLLLKDAPAWSKIRVSEMFVGDASCWHIFGAEEASQPLDANLQEFDPNLDVVRDAVRMGGPAGDAFDGVALRCDDTSMNFWYESNGSAARSATVILRRRDPDALAGLSTGADCGSFGPANTSPTWWEYREIYVK